MRCWLKPRQARELSATEAAWLAGFMDGEGTVGCHMGGRDGKYRTFRIQIPNTDLRALEHCQSITGVGRVIKKPAKVARKQQYLWFVSSQRDVAYICEQIYPYCLIKQEQIDTFFSLWKDLPEGVNTPR